MLVMTIRGPAAAAGAARVSPSGLRQSRDRSQPDESVHAKRECAIPRAGCVSSAARCAAPFPATTAMSPTYSASHARARGVHAGAALRWPRRPSGADSVRRKGEHIGGSRLAAKSAIELRHGGIADQAHGDAAFREAEFSLRRARGKRKGAERLRRCDVDGSRSSEAPGGYFAASRPAVRGIACQRRQPAPLGWRGWQAGAGRPAGVDANSS